MVGDPEVVEGPCCDRGVREFESPRPPQNAGVVQLVEHFLGKEEVDGSIPSVSSRICSYSSVVEWLPCKQQTSVRFRVGAPNFRKRQDYSNNIMK